MTNTQWNSQFSAPTITTPPYNSDGDASAVFTNTERVEIVAMWRAVSDAYSIFDVDVTTHDPSPGSASITYGTKVCIGGNSKDWLCPSSATECAGGVAFLGSFRRSDVQPAFVFYNSMVSAVWKATIHEGDFFVLLLLVVFV